MAAPGASGGSAVTDLEEWKECRATIDRFDKILVDLRKTGFSFVTALLGAATFLFGQRAPATSATAPPPDTSPFATSESAKFAVFLVIAVLVATLYLVDRQHQVWLQEAVDRAKTLEGTKRISTLLSERTSRARAALIELTVYEVFLLIVVFAFFASTTPDLTLRRLLTLTGYQGGMWLVFAGFQGLVLFLKWWFRS